MGRGGDAPTTAPANAGEEDEGEGNALNTNVPNANTSQPNPDAKFSDDEGDEENDATRDEDEEEDMNALREADVALVTAQGGEKSFIARAINGMTNFLSGSFVAGTDSGNPSEVASDESEEEDDEELVTDPDPMAVDELEAAYLVSEQERLDRDGPDAPMAEGQ